MDFQLDNNLPIWPQLLERMTERILTRRYPPGSKLPSVRELALEAGVNPNTMQRALSQLEANGLVVTHRTAGRVVTEDEAVLDATRCRLAQERIAQYFSGMAKIGYAEDNAAALIAERKEQKNGSESD